MELLSLPMEFSTLPMEIIELLTLPMELSMLAMLPMELSILAMEIMKTNEVRKRDSRGRHTTTWSEMLVLGSGGVLIDTPGLRDVQLWSDVSSIGETFREIIEIAEDCRFRDCNHSTEPGCAVVKALEMGKISESRLISYKKQKQEIIESSRRRELGEKKKHEPPVRPRRKIQRKKK